MRNPFSPGPGSPSSPGRELHTMLTRREITRAEYNIASALQTVDNLDAWYHPKLITPMTTPMRTYASQRANGGGNYDPPSAKRIGHWIAEAVKRFDEISGDLAHLAWCIEQVEKVNMPERIEKLKRKIAAMSEHALPVDDMRTALASNENDSRERQAQERARR